MRHARVSRFYITLGLFALCICAFWAGLPRVQSFAGPTATIEGCTWDCGELLLGSCSGSCTGNVTGGWGPPFKITWKLNGSAIRNVTGGSTEDPFTDTVNISDCDVGDPIELIGKDKDWQQDTDSWACGLE